MLTFYRHDLRIVKKRPVGCAILHVIAEAVGSGERWAWAHRSPGCRLARNV